MRHRLGTSRHQPQARSGCGGFERLRERERAPCCVHRRLERVGVDRSVCVESAQIDHPGPGLDRRRRQGLGVAEKGNGVAA
jgi:hypothetical protein